MMKYNGIYWNVFAPLIKTSIRNRYGEDVAKRSIKNGKKEYQRILQQADPIGDDNPMITNAYFAYVFVGAWLGSEKVISPEDMAEVMRDVLAKMKPFFGMVNLNSKKGSRKWYHDMKKYEKWYQKHGDEFPTTWQVGFDEELHQDGSYYYFTCCPICHLMNKLGYSEIMPALCSTDEDMFRYQHGVLHRNHTIAEGEEMCDYWVVGDQVRDPK